MKLRLAGSLFLSLFAVWGLASCEFSRPPAPTGSQNPPVYLLKFSSYSQDEKLIGYFTLGDVFTNQVAAAGLLTVQVYTTTRLSVGGSSGEDGSGGLNVKRPLYENTFSIGATNFHWETFGSMFTVNDLACRFVIPYSSMKSKVRPGRMAVVEIQFRPDASSNLLTAVRNVSLY